MMWNNNTSRKGTKGVRGLVLKMDSSRLLNGDQGHGDQLRCIVQQAHQQCTKERGLAGAPLAANLLLLVQLLEET